MEVLGFIFSGFWIFVGTLCLAAVVLQGVADIVRAFRGRP